MTYGPSSKNTYAKPKRKPGRVDLKIDELDSLIIDQGIKVMVTPTLLCPNRDAAEGTNHALDCPVCKGDEAVDLTAESYLTDAVIQGVNSNKEFQIQGVYDPKDAKITFLAENRVYYWYKVEVIDFASIYNEVIERGSGTLDKTRYRIFTGSCDVRPYIVDSLGQSYVKDVDFEFTENKQINWLTTGPLATSLYSISYPVLPTFRVLETLHDNRFYMESLKSATKRPVNLPQQAVIRWDFMADLSGNKELLGT